MDWTQLLVLGGGGFGLKTLVLYSSMTRESLNRYAQVYEPPQTSIILPTFNEEFFIEQALKSLEDQNVRQAYPDRFELIVVDSQSTDQTTKIARRYTDLVIEAPYGKLNAKHVGIMEAKGEVIVSVDADAFYPPNFLNLILRHFRDPNVVAVSSPRLTGNPLFNVIYVYVALWDHINNYRMIGSNCAFRKDTYLKCGGYDLNVNQLNRIELFKEEEVKFGRRIKQHGKYVWENKAAVFASHRHLTCPISGVTITCETPACKYCLERAIGARF